MEAAGPNLLKFSSSWQITDPNGTPITADNKKAKEVLKSGGSVMYRTGNVRFDANGDVSAPAVAWSFTESGTTAPYNAGGSRCVHGHYAINC